MNRATRPAQRGFTLIELAIVLLIFTLLVGGLAVPVVTQINNLRLSETRKIAEEVNRALTGWAAMYLAEHNAGVTGGKVSYLPCPDLTTALGSGTPNDGREDRDANGECLTQYGNLPWVDLGLGDTDGWHNRFHYFVSEDFANQPTGAFEYPVALDPQARICPAATACTGAANTLAVIVSHGRNGLGAITSANVAAAAPTSADELANTDSDADFVSRTATEAGSTAGEFDDLVLGITREQLIGRLAGAGLDLEP